MTDEQDDLAGHDVEQGVGEGARDAAEPPVGVEEGSPRVEPDPHRPQDATPSPRWSVVIPTRTGWGLLAATLPSLLATLGPDDEVVVVGDGRDPGVPAGLHARCRTVVHRGPAGFAPVCNRGASEARGRLLLFLNDDVAVPAGALDALERELAHPGTGAAGPDVLSEALGRSESGTSLRWRRGVLDARQDALAGTGRVEVPYLCGAALAVPSRVFGALGGFDERLAPYFWEDVDLSLRIRAAVGAVVVTRSVVVRHRHGATVSSEPARARRVVYERNRLLVSWRHLRGWRWLAHLAWLPLRLAASAARDRAVAAGFVQALAATRSGVRRGARRS